MHLLTYAKAYKLLDLAPLKQKRYRNRTPPTPSQRPQQKSTSLNLNRTRTPYSSHTADPGEAGDNNGEVVFVSARTTPSSARQASLSETAEKVPEEVLDEVSNNFLDKIPELSITLFWTKFSITLLWTKLLLGKKSSRKFYAS